MGHLKLDQNESNVVQVLEWSDLSRLSFLFVLAPSQFRALSRGNEARFLGGGS